MLNRPYHRRQHVVFSLVLVLLAITVVTTTAKPLRNNSDGRSSSSNNNNSNATALGYSAKQEDGADARTSSSSSSSCFVEGRWGCYSQGFADFVTSAEMCQIQCVAKPGCNYWSWHPNRGDKRCHLCHDDRVGNPNKCKNLPDDKQCVWGPRVCTDNDDDDDDDSDDEEIVANAVMMASQFCGNNDNEDEDPIDMLRTVALFMGAVKTMVDGGDYSDLVEEKAEEIATILGRDDCQPTVCNGGINLWTGFEQFLVVLDGNADRAFPRDKDLWRKNIFNDFRVFLADAHWLDEQGTEDTYRYFQGVPVHLQAGFTHEASFLTMMVNDAYKCNDKGAPMYGKFDGAAMFQVTERGFNVFKNSPGSSTEDAFGHTPKSGTSGDKFQTVLRHEAAHQFDRTMSSRQKQLRDTLKGQTERDEDWLRAGVMHWDIGASAYFKKHANEIIASQVGNQYFLSSSAQLAVGRYYAEQAETRRESLLPLAWFVFNVDIVGGQEEGIFYEDEQNRRVKLRTVSLQRDGVGGRVTGLSVPGCGTFAFQYDNVGLSGYSYDGDASWDSCIPEHDPTEAPSLIPTNSANPSQDPSVAPSDSSHHSTIPSQDPSSILSSVPSDSPNPSSLPSMVPTDSANPSQDPSVAPSNSSHPSTIPSQDPSLILSSVPSDSPNPSSLSTEIPTASPTQKSQKPKCKDVTDKITITNKKGTKVKTFRCNKMRLKKCSWRDEDGIKVWKYKCPVRCKKKIPKKHLDKLLCEFE